MSAARTPCDPLALPQVRVPHEDRKPGPGTGWIREEPTSTRGRWRPSQVLVGWRPSLKLERVLGPPVWEIKLVLVHNTRHA